MTESKWIQVEIPEDDEVPFFVRNNLTGVYGLAVKVIWLDQGWLDDDGAKHHEPGYEVVYTDGSESTEEWYYFDLIKDDLGLIKRNEKAGKDK